MKKIIIILLTSLIFSGCFMPLFYNTDNPCVGMNREQIGDWILYNIKYVPDFINFGVIEYWQSPKETLKNRSGDCEDTCILYIWLVYINTGEKYEMLGTHFDGVGHAFVDDGSGFLIEGDSGQYNYRASLEDAFISYTFTAIFEISTVFGLKSID